MKVLTRAIESMLSEDTTVVWVPREDSSLSVDRRAGWGWGGYDAVGRQAGWGWGG
jgi:hypothetical protein